MLSATENLRISLAKEEDELAKSAQLMFESEPWITLNFTLEKCKLAVIGDYKEVYIASLNGEFAGFAVIQSYGVLRGYIQTLAVVPQWRSLGIGRSLIEHCEERIFREHPNVFICVSSFNPRAQQLYKRLGYEKIGELKDHIVAGYDEWILRKATVPYAEFISKK